MDIERFRTFLPTDEFNAGRLHDYLMEKERRGWRLITIRLIGEWYDEAVNETRWEKIEIRDWRTRESLGIYTPDEYRELDYGHERWFDAEHYYE